jgi:excisionase family DNA binding protein
MHLISVKRAAKLLSVSPRTVQVWCRNGTLPCIQIQRTLRIVADKLPEDLRVLFSGEPRSQTEGALEGGNAHPTWRTVA